LKTLPFLPSEDRGVSGSGHSAISKSTPVGTGKARVDRLISPGSRRPAGVLLWLEVIEPTQPFRMRKKAARRGRARTMGTRQCPRLLIGPILRLKRRSDSRALRGDTRERCSTESCGSWVQGAQGRELSTKYPPYQTSPTAYSSGQGRQAGAHLACASRRKMTDCLVRKKAH
jgi:hypothetical protein